MATVGSRYSPSQSRSHLVEQSRRNMLPQADFSARCLRLLRQDAGYFFETVKKVHAEAVLAATFYVEQTVDRHSGKRGPANVELRRVQATTVETACQGNRSLAAELEKLRTKCNPSRQIAAFYSVHSDIKEVQCGMTVIDAMYPDAPSVNKEGYVYLYSQSGGGTHSEIYAQGTQPSAGGAERPPVNSLRPRMDDPKKEQEWSNEGAVVSSPSSLPVEHRPPCPMDDRKKEQQLETDYQPSPWRHPRPPSPWRPTGPWDDSQPDDYYFSHPGPDPLPAERRTKDKSNSPPGGSSSVGGGTSTAEGSRWWNHGTEEDDKELMERQGFLDLAPPSPGVSARRKRTTDTVSPGATTSAVYYDDPRPWTVDTAEQPRHAPLPEISRTPSPRYRPLQKEEASASRSPVENENDTPTSSMRCVRYQDEGPSDPVTPLQRSSRTPQSAAGSGGGDPRTDDLRHQVESLKEVILMVSQATGKMAASVEHSNGRLNHMQGILTNSARLSNAAAVVQGEGRGKFLDAMQLLEERLGAVEQGMQDVGLGHVPNPMTQQLAASLKEGDDRELRQHQQQQQQQQRQVGRVSPIGRVSPVGRVSPQPMRGEMQHQNQDFSRGITPSQEVQQQHFGASPLPTRAGEYASVNSVSMSSQPSTQAGLGSSPNPTAILHHQQQQDPTSSSKRSGSPVVGSQQQRRQLSPPFAQIRGGGGPPMMRGEGGGLGMSSGNGAPPMAAAGGQQIIGRDLEAACAQAKTRLLSWVWNLVYPYRYYVAGIALLLAMWSPITTLLLLVVGMSTYMSGGTILSWGFGHLSTWLQGYVESMLQQTLPPPGGGPPGGGVGGGGAPGGGMPPLPMEGGGGQPALAGILAGGPPPGGGPPGGSMPSPPQPPNGKSMPQMPIGGKQGGGTPGELSSSQSMPSLPFGQTGPADASPTMPQQMPSKPEMPTGMPQGQVKSMPAAPSSSMKLPVKQPARSSVQPVAMPSVGASAAAISEEIKASNPQTAVEWYNLGNKFVKSDISKVEIRGSEYTRPACYLEAIKLKPDLKEAWLNVGVFWTSANSDTIDVNGKSYNRCGFFAEAARLDPGFGQAWVNLGNFIPNKTDTVEVAGQHFTKVQAFAQALRCDDTKKMWWKALAASMDEEEVVEVKGKRYSKAECATVAAVSEKLMSPATTEKMPQMPGGEMDGGMPSPPQIPNQGKSMPQMPLDNSQNPESAGIGSSPPAQSILSPPFGQTGQADASPTMSQMPSKPEMPTGMPQGQVKSMPSASSSSVKLPVKQPARSSSSTGGVQPNAMPSFGGLPAKSIPKGNKTAPSPPKPSKISSSTSAVSGVTFPNTKASPKVPGTLGLGLSPRGGNSGGLVLPSSSSPRAAKASVGIAGTGASFNPSSSGSTAGPMTSPGAADIHAQQTMTSTPSNNGGDGDGMGPSTTSGAPESVSDSLPKKPATPTAGEVFPMGGGTAPAGGFPARDAAGVEPSFAEVEESEATTLISDIGTAPDLQSILALGGLSGEGSPSSSPRASSPQLPSGMPTSTSASTPAAAPSSTPNPPDAAVPTTFSGNQMPTLPSSSPDSAPSMPQPPSSMPQPLSVAAEVTEPAAPPMGQTPSLAVGGSTIGTTTGATAAPTQPTIPASSMLPQSGSAPAAPSTNATAPASSPATAPRKLALKSPGTTTMTASSGGTSGGGLKSLPAKTLPAGTGGLKSLPAKSLPGGSAGGPSPPAKLPMKSPSPPAKLPMKRPV